MYNKLLKIIEDDFINVPYHNFWMILESGLNPSKHGGICSDRVLFLNNKLKVEGFTTELYSAFIDGKSLHKIIKVEIGSNSYFVDTGLGWPLLSPIPLNNEIIINNYGVEFKTLINENKLKLIRLQDKSEKINYIIYLSENNEEKVLEELKNSYDKSMNYPFRNSIRFSQVIDNEFYFLKGNKFYYSKNKKLFSKNISTLNEFIEIFNNIFKFDIDIAKKVAYKLKMFQEE